jgi:hypothetical protein
VERPLIDEKRGQLRAPGWLGLAALSLVLSAPSGVFAQASDKALAEQLFRTGQDLMGQNRFAEACPKLAESQRLDPGTGTLLNLALCHEKEGKLASAWSEYNDAATFARRDQRTDRVQFAEQHIALLEPKLSRLIVQLAKGADAPGLEIRLDGERLGQAALGIAAPMDPGSHTVSASATGKLPWQTKIEIPAGPAEKTVTIPTLANAPAGSAPGTPPRAAPPGKGSGKAQRVGAYALGGLGIVGLGVGSIFGLRAISKNKESNEQGCDGNMCPLDAAATRRSATEAGNVSTVMFIVGGAALAGGITLYFTAPRAQAEDTEPAGPQASLTLRPGRANVELTTTW